MKQILSVLVENRAGVLNRVSGLFARRGYNIDSLAVGETEDPAISRITITLAGDDEIVNQVTRQLHKLPDVLMVRHLSSEKSFTRELAFIKVHADQSTRTQIIQIADVFRGHIVDVSPTTLTIELSGRDDKIAALVQMLQPFGIMELVRTGPIAIERGVNIMNVKIPQAAEDEVANQSDDDIDADLDAATSMPL